jgi:hypothetical protein
LNIKSPDEDTEWLGNDSGAQLKDHYSEKKMERNIPGNI